MAVALGAGPAQELRASVRLLRGSVLLALLLAGGLMVVGTAPPLAPAVSEIQNLTIGFVHLQLLGFASSALLLLLFPLPRLATSTFLAGTWAMLTILLAVGLVELMGRSVFFPLQTVLTATGVLTLVGAALLVRSGSERGHVKKSTPRAMPAVRTTP